MGMPEIQSPNLGLHINSGQCCTHSCARFRLKLFGSTGRVRPLASFCGFRGQRLKARVSLPSGPHHTQTRRAWAVLSSCGSDTAQLHECPSGCSELPVAQRSYPISSAHKNPINCSQLSRCWINAMLQQQCHVSYNLISGFLLSQQ